MIRYQVPDNTVNHDQIDTRPETPGEEDYDEDYLTEKTLAEIFKIHLKNFSEIPKVDPITKEKITFGSAFGKGLLATILCALRQMYTIKYDIRINKE